MSDLLALMISRQVVIALAVTGAVIAMVGSAMTRGQTGTSRGTARRVLWSGYGLTGLSIFFFILAGFL